MKASLSKLVPELERSYRTAIEQLAALHLRSDKVRKQIHEAATKGHRALRIPLPDGVDLRHSDGALEFEMWAKENGLHLEWSSRVATLEGGRQATGFDVEISLPPPTK